MIVVVTWTDFFENLSAHRTDDLSAAKAHAAALPPTSSWFAVDAAAPDAARDHLRRRFPNSQLARVLSALTGVAVARVESKDAGAGRIVDHLMGRAGDLPPLPAPESQPKESSMSRRVKVGPFKPIGRGSATGKVYDLIMGGTANLADIAETLGVAPEYVRIALASGRAGNGIAFSIAIDGTVAIEVPDGVELFRAAGEPKPKKPARVPFVGKGVAVRAGSTKAKVLEAALAGGTLAEVAAAAGTGDKTKMVLATLRKDHGVTHEIADDGALSVALPHGFDERSIFRQKAERPAPRSERVPRRADGPKTYAPGEFRPLPADSPYAGIVRMLAEGTHTLADIAIAGCTFPEGDRRRADVERLKYNMHWRLRYPLRRDHGITYRADDAGFCHLVLPEGRTVDDCVAA